VKVVYVAGRFRGATAWEIERNVRDAEAIGFEVAMLGASPLIPHANTRYFHGTASDVFWLEATLALLRKADAVVCVWNWKESEGAKAEVVEAATLGIPVFKTVEHLRLWLEAEPA